MPEKSVREMTRKEKIHYSLEAKTFRTSLMGSVILGFLALLIGLGAYTYAMVQEHVSISTESVNTARGIARQVLEIEPLCEEVRRIYDGLSPEEREKSGEQAYREKFAALTKREDYQILRKVLVDFATSSAISDIYVAFIDQERNALVMLCDPIEANGFMTPGEWTPIGEREAGKFLSWKGEDRLYDLGTDPGTGWMCTSAAPFLDRDGRILCFMMADVTMAEIGRSMNLFVVQYTLILSLAVVLVAAFTTRHMKRVLVGPINAIAQAAEQYALDKEKGAESEEHFAKLGIHTGDELENLSLVMADMETNLERFEENLARSTAEKERISTELNMAAEIQSSMLPKIFPAFPKRHEFDLYAIMHPAKEVGGDFYDFFMVDEDHLAMVVADVSGKGIPAALFMMIAKIILKTNSHSRRMPSEVLKRTNARLMENNKENMFVTVWLGILQISTGVLVYSDAGHERMALCHEGQWKILPKKSRCVALGTLSPAELGSLPPQMQYSDTTVQLHPGDLIFQYTDGVTEAVRHDGEMFGEARLVTTLGETKGRDPLQHISHVLERIDEFIGDVPQFDDTTMLCLCYKGMGDAPSSEK